MCKKKILFLAKYAEEINYSFENEWEEDYCKNYHKPLRLALENTGHTIISTTDRDYLCKNSDIDLVFSVYYNMNFQNSDAYISLLCEKLSIPYLGASPNVKIIDNDKALAKLIAKELDIKTPEFICINKHKIFPKKIPFTPPYFVKPRFGSTSRWIDDTCICQDYETLKNKSELFLKADIDVIIEKFIDGVPHSMPLIYGAPVITTKPYYIKPTCSKVFGFEAKMNGYAECKISEDELVNSAIRNMATRYFNEIQRCDYARIDFIIDKTKEIYFLEINTTPNLGLHGGFAQTLLDEKCFKTYDSIVKHLVELAIKRSNK
ncbi:MAG: ATP-grasp domain-containing protein [Chitinispirillales bacterium]|jgi:D-alanine-D-alanine ligase|nr:ATP-grasp domain-containing protein [Chitinispirillales bacterium]